MLSTGNLPRGGLPKNSVDRMTDRPDMTSAVDRGRKALTQQQQISTLGSRDDAIFATFFHYTETVMLP